MLRLEFEEGEPSMKRSLASTCAVAVTVTILTMGQPLYAQKKEPLPTLQRVPVQPVPCCVVTAIDSRTSIVTAKENANGRTFEFQVPNSRLLDQIHPGTPVYANFSTKHVSLNGTAVCCTIISISAPPPPPAPAPQSALAPVVKALPDAIAHAAPAPAGACNHSWLPQHPEYKGVICIGADTSRPAILLVHGLHQSGESWTRPSSVGYNYDFRHAPPEEDLGNHSAPNVGLYKAGTSAPIDVDSLNWFDYLVKQGFTVATWSQPCCNFGQAYPSAQQALAQFAGDTAAMNPSAPPLIALVGHSRGGLVIHKLLRDSGSLGGRIRWAITIHSPHHGSQVAETPQVLADDTSQLFAGVELPPEVKNPLKHLALQMVSSLNQLIDDGSKELAPQSSLITGLLNGDAPVAGVRYYTFGGTSPNLVRLYTWLFTPMSAVPQYKNLEQFFDWQAKPAEVGLVSPLLERVPAVVPEIKAGEGDSLVTDQSARLPYAVHETDSLNHAEVLWNRALQEKVARIVYKSMPPVHVLKP
jgi:hypothetical protein